MAKRKPLSEQLRDAVRKADVSRYRISQETGITEGQLCRFVHGESGLTLDTIDILAEYLGLELVQRKRKR
jgi:plasmid maintenance system antidote protein VapI